jgi:hypothetical protein
VNWFGEMVHTTDFAGPGTKKKTLPEGSADEENETKTQLKRAAVTVGEVIEYPLRPNCQQENSLKFHRREKHAQHCGNFRNNFFSYPRAAPRPRNAHCRRVISVKGLKNIRR